MERLKAKLFRLLKDELYSLSIGHNYNHERMREMRDLCRVITYFKFAEPSDNKSMQILTLYVD